MEPHCEIVNRKHMTLLRKRCEFYFVYVNNNHLIVLMKVLMKYNDKTQIDVWIKTKNDIDLIESLRTRPIHLMDHLP